MAISILKKTDRTPVPAFAKAAVFLPLIFFWVPGAFSLTHLGTLMDAHPNMLDTFAGNLIFWELVVVAIIPLFAGYIALMTLASPTIRIEAQPPPGYRRRPSPIALPKLPPPPMPVRPMVVLKPQNRFWKRWKW